MTGFDGITEVADRVWVAREAWFDVTVTVVAGEAGTVLVDTLASGPAMAELLTRLGRLPVGPVLAVAHTHAHFDHVLGTQPVTEQWPGVRVHAHENAEFETVHAEALAWFAEHPDARAAEVMASPLHRPEEWVSSVGVIDLGNRQVELLHPGRGHTAGDLVVLVPDADVVVLGDLVEESAPPSWGADSYPLEWPATLDLVLGLMGPSTVGVPGHGAVVDREFVGLQQGQIAAVAQQVADLAAQGVAAGDLLRTGTWPYPVEVLGPAVARAWEHLPRGSKRLPLA